MNEKLTLRQLTLIGSMLFGMFFGAGNLIFPLILGAEAGWNLPAALLGLLITAAGIPLLGVMSIGLSRSEGLLDLSGRVSPRFRSLFTCALYLTIGPLFAIPAAPPPALPSAWPPLREKICGFGSLGFPCASSGWCCTFPCGPPGYWIRWVNF